jgi:hypothetical protein
MAGGKGSQWEANRGVVGEVTLEVCGTIEDEASAIRDRIEGLRRPLRWWRVRCPSGHGHRVRRHR